MVTRTYSHITSTALQILGKMIKAERMSQGMSLAKLSERLGVSRSLVQRLEKCDPKCEIGVAFEAAHILGIELFKSPVPLVMQVRHLDEKIALLPQPRERKNEVSNEF